MSAEWDEVQRLAADLQRAQLSSTVQRLSERNCVEIVNRLVSKHMLAVLFTIDGKEYITPQQVHRDIKDELFVQGGRVHVSDLSQTLNLDYSHVEKAAGELANTEKRVKYVLGQLVDKMYLDRIFEEINEKLQQTGQITVGELAKQYDLPADFIQQSMRSRLGQILDGEVDPFDPQIVFTSAFIERHRARIRGAFFGVTRPTSVVNVINRYSLQDRLFFTTLDELVTSGQLMGTLSGGRQEKSSIYVPNVYARAKNDWVDSFYKQNNYLEYDALGRLGITDPRGFVRKRYGKQEHLLFLETCAINNQTLEQIEDAVEDQLAVASWAEIGSSCPSFFSHEDIQQIIHTMLSKSKRMSDARLFCVTVLVKNSLIDSTAQLFDDIIKVKAEQALQLGSINLVNDSTIEVKNKDTSQISAKKERKEDRRKKATGGKSGGGTQGRETKTKSVKKKYLRSGNAASDDEDDDTVGGSTKLAANGSSGQGQVSFMHASQIEEVLREKAIIFDECPDDLFSEVAQHLEGPLTTKFQELTRSLYLTTIGSNLSLRKSHGDVQDKINGLLINVNLFVKGADLLDDNVKTQLHKYLLKTVCSEIVDLVFGYVAQENLHTAEQHAHLTPEARAKLIGKLPDSCRDCLSKLNTSINGKLIEDFLTALDQTLANKTCDMIIKKVDKKKEKQAALGHKQALIQQLTKVDDAALVLHVSVLILFQTFTQNLLHASGKFVPQILSFLEKYLPHETYELMHDYQGLVIRHLTNTDNPEDKDSLSNQLNDLMPKIKEAAIIIKKSSLSDPNSI